MWRGCVQLQLYAVACRCMPLHAAAKHCPSSLKQRHSRCAENAFGASGQECHECCEYCRDCAASDHRYTFNCRFTFNCHCITSTHDANIRGDRGTATYFDGIRVLK